MAGDTHITDILGLGKATEKAIDVAAKLLEKLLAPSFDAGGDALAYPIKEWQRRRVERAHAVLVSSAQMLADAGLSATPVPGRILMPILECASVEEDPDLHRRWATLLASSAADVESVIPSHVEAMKLLTPQHATVLDYMYKTFIESQKDSLPPWPQHQIVYGVSEILKFDSMSTFYIVVADLVRLNLLFHHPNARRVHKRGKDLYIEADAPLYTDGLSITYLGLSFMHACTEPVGKKQNWL
jgi:hypothetical protein